MLVVDDSGSQRHILKVFLSRWGYRVIEAASGEEALAICEAHQLDVIISDWMMPGMSGLEFCRAFRALPDRPYGYFILLTSKSEKPEIARGLDVGADDFVSKPVSSSELLARVRAGERILHMERELREKNRLVSQTLTEISGLYEALDRDLVEARNLQQSLIHDRHRDFGTAQVSLLLLRSSGHVGGDLVGYFPINDDEVGLFALDVSGHGVASALLTARLAGLLTGGSAEQNVALEQDRTGKTRMLPPSEAAKRMNRLYLDEIKADQYFTMALGKADLTTGQVRFVQCGHPNPLVQMPDGSTHFQGDGGYPIGLFDEAEWEEHELRLPKGARLLLASDGLTECPDEHGNMLDEDGLARLMQKNSDLSGTELLEALLWNLTAFTGDQEFADDVSGVLFEYSG